MICTNCGEYFLLHEDKHKYEFVKNVDCVEKNTDGTKIICNECIEKESEDDNNG